MIERTHWDDCWKSGPAHYECAVGEVERLQARDEEWQRKASAWMASPEAVQWLDGYRELAQKLNAAEAEVERLRHDIERHMALLAEFVNRAEKAEAKVERLRELCERAAEALYECRLRSELWVAASGTHKIAARGES